MRLLSGLFENERLQEMALSFLRKQMKEGGTKYVVLSLNDDDTFKIDMLLEAQKPVILSQSQVDEIQKEMMDTIALAESLKIDCDRAFNTIEERTKEIDRISQICLEQEQAITNYHATLTHTENGSSTNNPD